VISTPSDKGEVGGRLAFGYNANSFAIKSNADIYRDRSLSNPENPNAINYNINTALRLLLSDSTQLYSTIYYSDTPQLISPQQLFRLDNRMTKTFELLEDLTVTTFLSYSFQTNRYDQIPSSEFDRQSISAGFRFPLLSDLSYFANYSYSFVDVLETDDRNYPSSFSTGISYSKRITDQISTNLNITYTDEEKADSPFSFLSGVDTLRGNIGINFHPTPDIEIFMDGSMRSLWAQRSGLEDTVDADVRFGLRTSWDTLFRWNPVGKFTGYVFKDYNRNGLRDDGEPGIKDVMIKIGNQRAITDRNGRYYKKVRAKIINLSIDVDTIPKGASFSLILLQQLFASHHDNK